MNNKKRKDIDLIKQFCKFGIVGLGNTVISLGVTYILMAFIGNVLNINTIWSLNICTTAGYIAGVVNSYYWNKKYVFKDSQEKKKKVLIKTFICYGATYLLSMLIMDFLVDYMHVSKTIAPIPRLIITVPLNFLANKLWAYKDSSKCDQ